MTQVVLQLSGAERAPVLASLVAYPEARTSKLVIEGRELRLDFLELRS